MARELARCLRSKVFVSLMALVPLGRGAHAQGTAYATIDVKDGGSVSGTVSFPGAPPFVPVPPVTRNAEVCVEERPNPALELGPGGALANALVSLTPLWVGKDFPRGSETARLEVKACAFAPHIQVVRAGATVEIVNRDPLLHDVHAYLGSDTLFTQVLPLQNYRIRRKLVAPGLVALKCDAGHPWMSGFLFVSPHPYVAVTDPKGAYAIKGVPPGIYQLKVWHELLGEKTLSLKVEPRRSVTLDVPLSAPVRPP